MPPLTRILIVEDEDILAENLQSFLARSAQDVRIAGDSHSTIKVLESFTPDIVVLDFGLPGMDGLQTYAVVVRHRAPQAGCVMISGHMTEDLARTASDQGIHHVLCKPFSFVELQEMIDLCLNDTARADKTNSDTNNVSTNKTEHDADHLQIRTQIRTKDRRVTNNRRSVERRIIPDRRQHNVFSLQM